METNNTATASAVVLPSVVAHAINLNCEHYHAANISHAEWSAEQNRLWDIANVNGISVAVARLVAPR